MGGMSAAVSPPPPLRAPRAPQSWPGGSRGAAGDTAHPRSRSSPRCTPKRRATSAARPRGGARLPGAHSRPRPAPTLSQRPQQVQLEQQQRPPPAARAELCRPPPGGAWRRAGSRALAAEAGARPGPRALRGRRAAGGHRGPGTPDHAEELPPGAPRRTGRPGRPRVDAAPSAEGRRPGCPREGRGGGRARRRRSCQRGQRSSRRPEFRGDRRRRQAGTRGSAALSERGQPGAEAPPPPPPPPGAEEKVRPPARRLSPSAAAAAAPHSQPGRTRRPRPPPAADWPREAAPLPGPAPTALACFQTRRARPPAISRRQRRWTRATSRAGCAP
nr:translation initiation factor IF-2 [Oryctolagus cuniculus]